MTNILMARETGADTGLLASTSVWNPVVLFASIFTLECEVSQTHFTKSENRRYVCPGNGCPACAAGERTTKHTLMPIWNLKSRKVEILILQMTTDGPRDRVVDFLRSYEKDLANIVVKITSSGNGEISVKALTPNADTDRGPDVCQRFAERLSKGEIQLYNCFTALSVDEIGQLPEIAAVGSLPIAGDQNLDFAEYDGSKTV